MRVWQTLSSNAQGSSSSRSVRPRRLLSAFMVIPSVRKRARCFIRSSASSTSLVSPERESGSTSAPSKSPAYRPGASITSPPASATACVPPRTEKRCAAPAASM